jgi:hypothetical protein
MNKYGELRTYFRINSRNTGKAASTDGLKKSKIKINLKKLTEQRKKYFTEIGRNRQLYTKHKMLPSNKNALKIGNLGFNYYYIFQFPNFHHTAPI